MHFWFLQSHLQITQKTYFSSTPFYYSFWCSWILWARGSLSRCHSRTLAGSPISQLLVILTNSPFWPRILKFDDFRSRYLVNERGIGQEVLLKWQRKLVSWEVIEFLSIWKIVKEIVIGLLKIKIILFIEAQKQFWSWNNDFNELTWRRLWFLGCVDWSFWWKCEHSGVWSSWLHRVKVQHWSDSSKFILPVFTISHP